MMFMATQLASNKEKDEMAQIFLKLDKDGDGTLSRDELLEGYTKLYGSRERAAAEVDILMKNADVDGSGTIDYSGNSLLNY